MAQRVERVTALKLTVADRVGTLAQLVADARDAGIDLRSVAAVAHEGQGTLFAIPVDLAAARQAAAGAPYAISEQDVIWVEGDDERGALGPVADKLAGAGINILAVHATAVEGKFAAAFYLAPEDMDRAGEALGL